MMNITKSLYGKIFLFFIAATFILFGISSFFFSMSGYNVIKAKGQKVSINTFVQTLNQRRQEALSKTSDEKETERILSKSFRDEILNNVAREVLLNEEIERIGLLQSNKKILKEIVNETLFKNATGKFSVERYNNFLKNSGFTENSYIKYISEYSSRSFITSTYVKTAPVVDFIIKDLTKFNNEVKIATIYEINPKNVNITLDKPKEEDIEAYYKNNMNKFLVPSIRDISYVNIDFSSNKNITVSEKEIKEEYDKNKKKYEKPETHNFYYFVSESQDEINTVYKELLNKQNPVSVAQNVLGMTKENVYLKDVEIDAINSDEIKNLIYSLKPKQFSKVTKIDNFYMVIYLDSINKPKELSYSELKNDIKSKLISEKKAKYSEQLIYELQDYILVANNMEELAKKFDLKVNKLKNVNSYNIPNEIKNFMEIFDYQEGDFSDLQVQKDGTYRIYYVDKVIEESFEPLAEVKNEVIRLINEPKIKEALEKEIEETKIRNINNISTKYKASVKNRVEISNINFIYPEDFVSDIFSLENNKVTKLYVLDNGNYVFGIVRGEKYLTEDSEDYISESSVEYLLARSYKVSILNNYIEILRNKYNLKISQKILNMVD